MDWFQRIDGYCERTDFTYWSEPLNAATNAAFLIAAIMMWRRTAGLPTARVLCAILFAIGVGSYLFHTEATAWAATADTAPIGIFILVYLFAINRDVLGLRWWWAALATALFIPYAGIVVPALETIPFLRISNFYWTVPILLLVYGAALRGRHPDLSRGLWVGAVILSASIILRSLDEILCSRWPYGTHFGWHLLNGLMLGWMIHVYAQFRRGVLAAHQTGR